MQSEQEEKRNVGKHTRLQLLYKIVLWNATNKLMTLLAAAKQAIHVTSNSLHWPKTKKERCISTYAVHPKPSILSAGTKAQTSQNPPSVTLDAYAARKYLSVRSARAIVDRSMDG